MEQTPNDQEVLTNEQMLAEILENSRATKKYMKWQLIITVAMVVIPLLGIVIAIPLVLNTLGSVYGQEGILQNIQGMQ